MKIKALTETMKLKSALVDNAVEGNPVMARCLKCKKGNEAAFHPYLEIKGNGRKQQKQMTINKIFFSPNALNQCQTTPIITSCMTFLNTPLFFTLQFLLL
jgi:hypothetical protein